jgi:hypothetical protein
MGAAKSGVTTIKRLPLLLLVISLLLTVSACSQTVGASAVKLEYAAANPSAATQSQFNEQNSYVIRCLSSADNVEGLTISATKTKSAKITSLVFVALNQAKQSNSSMVQIALVPVKGSESDYDMAGAKYNLVSLTSAQNIVDSHGITYTDWLTGITGNSDNFPCCQ